MSTGKLKAQYNRVRTSTALHTTSIWSNTIGLQQDQAGTNSVIEAQIYAPGGGGGGGRAAKRQRAQELIEATGYQPSVRDFEGLKALARRQGGDNHATNRGACKICGGLGHLTKQCRNFLDNGSNAGAAGAAAGAAGGGEDRQLLTADDDDALLLESNSMDSSGLGSDSDSGRSGERKRKHKRSSRDKDRERSSKKHKKEKSKKSKKEKSSRSEKKSKSERRRSRSRSRDRTGRDRSRSRSPVRRS